MMHEELRAATFQEAALDQTPLPTFVVPGPDAAAGLVIGGLADYFGADPERELCRLRFSDGLRYLARASLYQLVGGGTKSFGDGGYAALPGYSGPGQATEFEFHCPVPDCPDSPVFLFAFEVTPLCYRHRVPLELAG
jgi:hypothetical protein